MNIIQLGANTGNDHVYELVKNIQLNKLVLVEALPFLIPTLTNTYKDIKNVHIENVGIVTDQSIKEIKFYYSENDGRNHNFGYEISSTIKDHVVKYGNGNVTEINVPCITIMEIIKKYEMCDIDYLFVDCERLDVDIILSLDLKDIKIKNIQFETIDLLGKDKLIYDWFETNNYIKSTSLHKFDSMFTLK